MFKLDTRKIIMSFFVYSFFIFIGLLGNILSGELEIDFIDGIIYTWMVVSLCFIYYLSNKLEKEKITNSELKKELKKNDKDN